jgi:hypothetical protein
MQDAINRLLGVNQRDKIHSIQNIRCNKCDGKEEEIILIIFDDGHTSFICSAKKANHYCHFEILSKPTKWYRQLGLYAVIVIVFIITLTYNLIKAGIIKI